MEPSIWGPNDTLPTVGFVPFSAGAAICPAHNLVPAIASFAIGALLSEADITLLQPSLTVDDLPGTLNHFDIRLRLSKRPVKARTACCGRLSASLKSVLRAAVVRRNESFKVRPPEAAQPHNGVGLVDTDRPRVPDGR
jgi:hypothetical protein